MPLINPNDREPPNYDDYILRKDDSAAQRYRLSDRSESGPDDDEEYDDYHRIYNDKSQMLRRRSYSTVENDVEDDDDEEEEEEKEVYNDTSDDEIIQRFVEPSYGKDPIDHQCRGYSSFWRQGGNQ